MADDIARFIATIQAAIRSRPDYPDQLIGLAETVQQRGHPSRAVRLAREAMALAEGGPGVRARGRRLLSSLAPGYHVPMMNDARRNAAWDKAIRAAVKPGMTVLEIGTGAGMLALMAARAGASVVTCEQNSVVAAAARALAERNGLGERIEVIAKRSAEVTLERPADLLICDIFGDRLLDFDPIAAIDDVRRRGLLAKGAAIIPRSACLRAAFADWSDYRRSGQVAEAAGFDLGPFADFVPTVLTVPIGSPDLKLMSKDWQTYNFYFGWATLHGHKTRPCEILHDGEVNAIAHWIQLVLDDDTILEARPEPGARFFSSPTLFPLDAPVAVRAGDTLTMGASYQGRSILTWLA
ncbi:MAG: 50S ribosomal protein L11 methyltransferase [Pseudomonadota bacterium]